MTARFSWITQDVSVSLKFLLGTANAERLFYYPFTAWYTKGFKKIQPIDHRAGCPWKVCEAFQCIYQPGNSRQFRLHIHRFITAVHIHIYLYSSQLLCWRFGTCVSACIVCLCVIMPRNGGIILAVDVIYFMFLRPTCSLQKLGQLWESDISPNSVSQVLIYCVTYHQGFIFFLIPSLWVCLLALFFFL